MRIEIDHQGAGFLLADMRPLRDTLCIAVNDISVDIARADRIKSNRQFCVIGTKRADHPDDAMF
jgi:hypothetical protein